MSHNHENGKTCCRCDGNLDHQLGHIQKKLKYLQIASLNLNPYDDKFNNIFIDKNVFPIEFAIEIRNFLRKIPFDKEKIRLLNDIDNLPSKSVMNEFQDIIKINQALANPINDPFQWEWVLYLPGMYRLAPLSLASFIGSPIKVLIDLLEAKWNKTNFYDMKFSKMEKATWVLQMIPPGEMLYPHTDENLERKIAFIYYLTDDDWNHDVNGGALIIYNHPNENLNAIYDDFYNKKWDIIKINPAFNSLITWKVGNNNSPIHMVSTVKNGLRYALVGFYV
jgi:hypothetical protein